MKGLDTPVLLGLLRGDPRVTALLRKWEGEELCTTSVNLFELETIARTGRAPGRERRLAAIERLRRKLTVLPIEERSARLAAQQAARATLAGASSASWLILGALQAGGCNEWATVREACFPDSSDLKVTVLAPAKSKA
ncbi:MAG: PIN domain-containing protein [Thermoplasmata archaeon]|nr:PIN domain-containing protein [Thermoplasmata archaeon]MCI4358833.1 PIN domain-containing protein [Thermoplasmata archaeon]